MTLLNSELRALIQCFFPKVYGRHNELVSKFDVVKHNLMFYFILAAVVCQIKIIMGRSLRTVQFTKMYVTNVFAESKMLCDSLHAS